MTHLSLSVTGRLLGAGIACALLLGYGATPARADTPKDTLVIADQLDSSITMDPAESFEGTSSELMGSIYDRLVRFDPAHPDQPMMDVAKDFKLSPDGKTYTFTIRPGMKFASGNPVTAEEAAWSLQRAIILDKSPAFILSQFGFDKDNVKERIKATGPMTLTLVTDRAYAPSFVLNCLTANVGGIVDKNLLLSHEQNGDMGYGWLKTSSAGSGPMKLREWRANEVMLLERNDTYWGRKAPLARVIYRHVKESATQRLLLAKGDIDVALDLDPQDLDALAQQKGIKTVSTPVGVVYYISLNQKNPTLAKPEVREAMKWLVDYSAMEATIMKNIGIVNQNFLPQGLLGAVKENPYKLDVAKAKALLAKAGCPNGFKVTMDVRSVQPNLGLAEAFQQSAKLAGIDIELITADGKQVLTKYRARKHDMMIYNWECDYWDPHTNADTFARNPDNADDAKSKPLAWRNAWDIPELTRLSDAAVLERDTRKRARMYQQIQAEFRKNGPFIMLFQQIAVAGVRSNVEGFKPGVSAGTTYLFNVSKN
jgi:peptide/nickel transport system substrate-binding protein